jgi:hypothetical protein
VGWDPPAHDRPTPAQEEADTRAVAAAGLPLPKEEGVEELGMGWSKVFHPEYRCFFYRHDARQLVQWEVPADLMPEPGTDAGAGAGVGVGVGAGAGADRRDSLEDRFKFCV